MYLYRKKEQENRNCIEINLVFYTLNIIFLLHNLHVLPFVSRYYLILNYNGKNMYE